MNQLKVGSILSYLSMGLHIVIGLFYVPLLLQYLSIEEYGLFQLIGSLVAYLSIMDFGLTSTITRFYSRRIAMHDERGKENILAISLIIFFVLSLLTIIIGLIVYLLFPVIYSSKIGPMEIVAGRKMILYLVGNTGITIISKVFIASITSLEHFIFLRLLTIIQTILQPIGVVAILTIKAEALSIVKVQVAFNVLYVACIVYYALKVLHVRIRLHELDKHLVGSILRFSSFVFLQIIFDLVIWRTGVLILGAIAGPAMVAVFSIAIQLNMYYKQFATAINSVLFPLVSRMSIIHKGMTEMSDFFSKIGRLQFIVLGLILSGFIVFGSIFLNLWVGKAFALAYSMTLIMMIPFTFDLIENIGVMILQAKDLHETRAKIFMCVALFTILTSYTGTKFFGGIGTAVAIGISLLLGHGFIMNFYYARIGIDIASFFRSLMPVSLVIVFMSIAGRIIINLITINTWFKLGASSIIFSLIYTFMIVFMVLHKEERASLFRILPFRNT